jgi:hypothetical protein
LIRSVLLGLFAAGVLAADPKIFFSKTFPGSVPPYFEIQVDKSGAAVYKEAPDDDDASRFQLTDTEVSAMFQLAEKLSFFNKQLESGLKVAKTGDKIFRWTDGAKKHEAKFNYSQDPDAQALLDWFEKIGESQQLLASLERTVKFDRLGVHKTLLQVELAWNRKRLVGLDQFLPLLDRVRKNESYLHMARERASVLAEAFRNAKPGESAGNAQ